MSLSNATHVRTSKHNNNIMIGVFVDDMVIAYSKEDEKEWHVVKNVLKSKYDVSDLGELNHILGMKITRSPGKVCMSQQLYINDKLALYDMNECTSVSVPEATVKLVPAAKDDVITDRKEMSVYRGIIGSLIYASISTRPDITHAVNMLSRYMHTPSQTHMNAARRVLRYLKSCTEYGLVYDNGGKKNTMNDPLTITAYSDSDWGGDAVDSKSTTGYVVLLNGNLITWNTRKQNTVALSSAEAELMALVEVTKEMEWLSMLLGEAALQASSSLSHFR